jgi:hypothetical protein
MAELQLQILYPRENVAPWVLCKTRSTTVAASLPRNESMTTSLNSPTVVKSAPQPIDPIPGPKPDLRTAIARPIREVIKQELTTDLVSDLPTGGTRG